MDLLKGNLFKDFDQERLLEQEGSFITNIRHENLIGEALQALARANRSMRDRMPHEVLLLDLYAALRALNAMTGETTVEDILDNIFSTFCIGK